MPLTDFLNLDYYKGGLYGEMLRLGEKAIKDEGYKGFSAEELPTYFSRGKGYLYSAKL